MNQAPMIYDADLDLERAATQADFDHLHALGEVGHLLAEIRLYCFAPRGRKYDQVRKLLRAVLRELEDCEPLA